MQKFLRSRCMRDIKAIGFAFFLGLLAASWFVVPTLWTYHISPFFSK